MSKTTLARENDADACGAIGCRSTDELVLVTGATQQRVLCGPCLEDYVRLSRRAPAPRGESS